MSSWDERKKDLRAINPPDLGEKLIWVKGGGARNRAEHPLMAVWFIQRNEYNWTVMGEDGSTHNVLPTRLFSEEDFKEWMEAYGKAEPPAQIAHLSPKGREKDAAALKDLPEELRSQLSSGFRDRYNL